MTKLWTKKKTFCNNSMHHFEIKLFLKNPQNEYMCLQQSFRHWGNSNETNLKHTVSSTQLQSFFKPMLFIFRRKYRKAKILDKRNN